MGLPPPEFQEQSEFVVTFRKAPSTQAGRTRSTLWDEEELGPGVLSALEEQEQRLAQAMQYVQQHEQITNREYRKLTGVSEATALRDLELLVERGALRAMGKRRSRHYRLP